MAEKIIEQKAADSEYLHLDFHGAMCFVIKYLDDNLGGDAATNYLKEFAATYFMPLSQELKREGLEVLEKHWKNVFGKENGHIELYSNDKSLVLKVLKCPAVNHLKKNKMFYTNRFCETTAVVNQTICDAAGYECRCQYNPGEGTCIQEFWVKEQNK